MTNQKGEAMGRPMPVLFVPALLVACAPAARHSGPEIRSHSSPAALVANNRDSIEVTVSIISGNARHVIGTVPPTRCVVFEIDDAVLNTGRELRIAAAPRGSRTAFISDAFDIARGKWSEWILERISLSTLLLWQESHESALIERAARFDAVGRECRQASYADTTHGTMQRF
jgi:hypothetical protein